MYSLKPNTPKLEQWNASPGDSTGCSPTTPGPLRL